SPRLRRAALTGARICERTPLPDGRGHFWWPHEGAAGDVESDARFATPANEDGQAPVALAAGGGDDAFGNLALEHQHEPVVPGRPWFEREPADQQRSGNVVGQVRNDARGSAVEQRARIEVERIAGNDLEASRIPLGDLVERRDRAVVALDRDPRARVRWEERAGEPARPGTDLDHVYTGERTRRAGDASGEVEIEKKILAKRLLGSETVSAYHLAERWKTING